MAWSTPKTNWVSTDYFNYSDYTRIRDNMIALKEIADACYFGLPSIENMSVKNSYTDMFYASDMNRFENNLDLINTSTLNLNIGSKVTYVPNGATPSFTEFNRLEGGMKLLYETLLVQYNLLKKLAFTLGGAKFKV